MPEEWPIAAPVGEAAAPAHAAGRGRLRTVQTDFFLPPEERLSEQERALMTAMLHVLVEDVASNLRACLPASSAAANDSHAALVQTLGRAGLLNDAILIGLLLERAEQERIGSAARARSGRREARALQALVSHPVPEVSAAAMALILARGRRRDKFGQPLLVFDDLPRPTADRLVNAVAAALSKQQSSTRELDGEFAAAAIQVLARHDDHKSAVSVTEALVRRLAEADALADDLLLACAQEGEVMFIACAAGVRGHLTAAVAIDELLSGDECRIAGLMRVGAFSREVGAGILASIGDLLGLHDAGAAIDLFDSADEQQLSSARAWLVTSPFYRAALEALGGRDD